MAASAKPNLFLRRPVLSAVISILITLVGALAMKALPIAQYPDLVPPTVNVSVSYPGASAETIAATVLAPLEVNINGVASHRAAPIVWTVAGQKYHYTCCFHCLVGSNPTFTSQ